MRIGIVCEGEYTDKPVLELILHHLFPSTEFDIDGVDSKEVIYRDIDLLLTNLANDGAQRTMILWDRHPAGLQMPVPSQRSPGLCQYACYSTSIACLGHA